MTPGFVRTKILHLVSLYFGAQLDIKIFQTCHLETDSVHMVLEIDSVQMDGNETWFNASSTLTTSIFILQAMRVMV